MEAPAVNRFEASGLTFSSNKELLVVRDKETALYRIDFKDEHVAKLEKTKIFAADHMEQFRKSKSQDFDFEGLARDEQGRIYVCEEDRRGVFRWDPSTKSVEQLPIDWTPVKKYFSEDRNASFEGIAVGDGKLWLANERDRARIIEVDLQSLKVVSDFGPLPTHWAIVLHYSDLCWFKGRLFVLLRHHRLILEINPENHDVLAEYNYASMEDAPQHEYRKNFPTGVMEGLTVDDEFFWLVTDNNGLARMQDASDHRPTLFKCKRPESR